MKHRKVLTTLLRTSLIFPTVLASCDNPKSDVADQDIADSQIKHGKNGRSGRNGRNGENGGNGGNGGDSDWGRGGDGGNGGDAD